MQKQYLLISVRGPREAKEAVLGGADIIDAEYPESALGTPYPLNIMEIKKVTPPDILVSTNIGEKQFRWSTAAQAALGVALAGADVVKIGLGGLRALDAKKVAERSIRSVKWWFPTKNVIPAFFADPELTKYVTPLDSPEIASNAKADGVLLDTFDKFRGKCLKDFFSINDTKRFVDKCHKLDLEAWIAGSITKEQLVEYWGTGVDVICIREAACDQKKGRKSRVKKELVKELKNTIPKNSNS